MSERDKFLKFWYNIIIIFMKKIELKNRKNQKIVGVLEKPKREIRGTCIVQHGWGGKKEQSTVQAIKNAFLESGFQTFNFDTTNSFNESDGDFEKSTLGLHWEDLEDVVKWSQKQDWFEGILALSGHSKGGYAVTRYTEEYPKEVNILVPVAPVVSGKLSFEIRQKINPKKHKEWKKKGVIESVAKDTGIVKRKHWFQMSERLDHDLIPNAFKVKIPMLIVVGEKDTSCPPEHMKILFDAVSSKQKNIAVIAGAPHSFYKEQEQKDCTKFIKDWLKKIN